MGTGYDLGQGGQSSPPYLPHRPPLSAAQRPSFAGSQRSPQPHSPRKRSGALTALILGLLVAVLIGGALAFYLGYYQLHQAQVGATATAQAQISGTASGTALVVQKTVGVASTATASAQITVIAHQTLYAQATSGEPVFNDSLSGQSARQWDQLTSSAGGSCAFAGGSYRAKMPTVGYFQPCFAEQSNFSDQAFQVTLSMVTGNTGGLIFRANSSKSTFYLFRVNLATGNYEVFLYTGTQANQAKVLLRSNSGLLKNGQPNTLTVVARGSSLNFYINQQYVNSISDSTYASGQSGVFCDGSSQACEAAFSHAEVWSLA